MLASTSYHHLTESAAPGEGRGGGIGGGVPARYDYTGRARCTISPWIEIVYAYSLLQLYLGNNSLSNLEVASMLNILNLGTHMYNYHYSNRPAKYAPKVYLGTVQTTATSWNYDSQNTSKPPANQWPQNFGQTSQKGEANYKLKNHFLKLCKLFTLYPNANLM